MNFFEGSIEGSTVLRLDDGSSLQLPLSDPKGRERITMGVRPEHFELAEAGWPATVSVVEATGSETQITARLAGKLIRVLVRGRTDVKAGQTIHLTVQPALIHMFDPAPIPDVALDEDL